MRTQKRMEEHYATLAGALANVLLYGSDETQTAALEVLKTLGEKGQEIGAAGKPGTPKMASVVDEASLDVGDKGVAWRRAAQTDLRAPLTGN
jgi:hypothetical protein